MKKILFAAFAASLLAASCQKTEVYQPTTTGPEMTFSTEMKKITKVGTSSASAEGKDDNLKAQGFNIWAYADYDLTNATNVKDGIYDGMNGWFVDYQNSSWNPNKKYYWPGTGKDLRFFAVSSITTEKTSGDITSRKSKYTIKVEPGIGTKRGDDTDDTEPSITIENFKVNHEAPNEDLMVAKFVKQNQNNKTVKLDFHHTLSKVQFLFKTTPDKGKNEEGEEIEITPNVKVNSIKVASLLSEGTLIVSKKDYSMNTDFIEEEFEWTLDETTAEFGNTSVLPLTKDPVVYDTWLMLPQSIQTKKIKISYTIEDREFEAIFNLTGNIEGFTNWARNQYIKYTIDISPNKIKFDASSTPWTKFDGDGDENKDSNGDNDKKNDDIEMNN